MPTKNDKNASLQDLLKIKQISTIFLNQEILNKKKKKKTVFLGDQQGQRKNFPIKMNHIGFFFFLKVNAYKLL